MKIKSIGIVGFKSFVDKITLNFLPGITALVGPNGCGKSNIVDAFLWAMGEQSAKQLRGKTMEDVIFNGSDNRKPMGMAEVSITFSNENGSVPYEYNQYSEIMVTRRLFRSGESEYYINKIPCRLKDITELFLDTGVGAKAYSIIEQGKVEQIINSKPLERRTFIDEAAGISKYKNRKKEALVKIESTKSNLLRIDDIIVEVKRQLNSIKRQASRLKRYQKLKEEVKKIELNSSLLKYVSLKEKHCSLKEQLDQSKKDEIKIFTQISSIEASFEGEKIDLTEEEKIYHRIQEEIFKTSSLSQKEESRFEYLNRELLTAKDQHNHQLDRIKALDDRLNIQQSEIKNLEQKNLDRNQTLNAILSSLINKEEQLPVLKEEHRQLEDKIENEKNKLIDLLTELTQLNNHLTQLDRDRYSLVQKIEYNKAETKNLITKLSHLEQKISVHEDDLSKTDTTTRQYEEEKAIIESTISTATEDLHQCEFELNELKEQWERYSSRLLSLQELQKKFEDCDAGVRSIMLRNQNSETEHNGVCGLLADFVDTDPQYETALESVLGEKLHYVVVKSQQAGVEAIEYLKAQSSGRVSFIPMQIRRHQLEQLYPSIDNEKLRPLIQLVNAKEEYQPIVNYLLNDVLLVDNLTTAIKIWNANGIKHTLVTMGGEIIDSAGIITGGIQNGVHSKIFSKKREVQELNLKLSELKSKLEHLQNQKQQLTDRLSQLKEEHNSIQAKIHQGEISLLSLNRDKTQSTKELEDTCQCVELLTLEKEELSSTLKEVSNEFSKLEEEKKGKVLTQNKKESSLALLQDESRSLAQQIENLQNEITRLKVQAAAEKEKSEHNILTIQRMEKSLSTLREEHAQTLKKCEIEKQKQITLEDELLQTNFRIESYQKTKQELEQSLDKKREAIVQKENNAKQKEEVLKDLRNSLEEVKSKSNDFNIHMTEINLNLSHLLKEIDEKYHLSLESLLHTTPIEHIDEDQENSYQKLDELRSKIESLGEVNLAAAQEQEELINRHQFLREQREDLTKSLESLSLVIKKINRTTKQRFLEAYHMIDEKFKKVFPELFQGGKAELRLTDEDNIFETGIDIVAQPPGKKLQTIDLLSGGEKSLAAIALLMAIYLVKPSPFCLLDEADSSLDDTNAIRFNQYIKNICHDSQFILITHNKLTMQIANILYGITMEEPGVSKTVSVQLH
jgi:chromosome segregation protein